MTNASPAVQVLFIAIAVIGRAHLRHHRFLNSIFAPNRRLRATSSLVEIDALDLLGAQLILQMRRLPILIVKVNVSRAFFSGIEQHTQLVCRLALAGVRQAAPIREIMNPPLAVPIRFPSMVARRSPPSLRFEDRQALDLIPVYELAVNLTFLCLACVSGSASCSTMLAINTRKAIVNGMPAHHATPFYRAFSTGSLVPNATTPIPHTLYPLPSSQPLRIMGRPVKTVAGLEQFIFQMSADIRLSNHISTRVCTTCAASTPASASPCCRSP